VLPPWFIRQADPVLAARRAAAATGCEMADYQALKIVEAVLACADGAYEVREMLHREAWEDESHRDRVRQSLRHKLLDKCAREALVPTMLPVELLRHFEGLPMLGSPDGSPAGEVPAWAVESGAAWHMVEVSLTVAVRRPVIDRVAAVRAGLL
jgi:hypothetical protein